jgi:para-nitrobenzyl esterase
MPLGGAMKILALGAIAAVVSLLCPSLALASPSVEVDGITINGTVSAISAKVDEFYGIPYATAARWQPPKAHAALGNPFDAAHPTMVEACPQPGVVVFGSFVLRQSEDCLSLNVYVPASATAKSKLPVLFWIHGGSLVTGVGADYDAAQMIAAHNIIVVTINYRLGALGWLAQKSLQAAKSDSFQNKGDAGNYGLMDQQFALQWVKKNIAAFGGDPAKVTIDGESAGGLSVLLNLASVSTAKGLFRGAIVESGAYLLHSLPSQAAYEKQYGNAFVDAVLAATPNVNGVACNALTAKSSASRVRTCLRGATVATLLTQQNAVFGSLAISPDFGPLTLPNSLQTSFSGAKFIRVPVLQGINANEGRFFEPGFLGVPTNQFAAIVGAGGPANYDLTHLNSLCGTSCSYTQEVDLWLTGLGIGATVNTAAFDSKLANSDYPLASFPDYYMPKSAPSADEGLAQILTDYLFACNSLDATTEMAKNVAVYAYEFNDPFAPPLSPTPAVTVQPDDQYGYPTASEHGAEIQFLFDFPFTADLSSSEQKLAKTMQSYWSNFVKSANPNVGATVPSWPAFSATPNVQTLAPGTPASHTTFGAKHFCAVWEPIISKE